jgi:hypothetical protein
MGLIKGMDVVLINLTDVGNDEFNNPIYEPVETTVHNVLVYPATADDVVSTLDLYGKKAVYKLGIPKGDAHIWQDQDVRFFGETFHVFTTPQIGIESNVPTEWHHIYMCERYE